LGFSLLLESAFLIMSALQDSFWIASCTVLRRIEPCQRKSNSCHHLLDDIIMWIGLLIGSICLPEVANGSFSEH